ncbi:methyltransferase family protein [Pseudactinotalea sp. Z1748]|uniref:methyltransferase family protein n=1 Tax=Pseudactinotalea sp. Z1748 TaxID=3413027 RepID=UPI003C7D320C
MTEQRQEVRWLDTSGAHVRVLPPALFGVPLALAALMHRRRPLPARRGGTGPPRASRRGRFAGALLAAAGLGLMLWAFWTMRRHHTTVVPWARVDELVTSGPYAHVRNPIYAADLLIYLGVSLRLGSLWPLLALPAVLGALQRWVIEPEETYLSQRFGRRYTRYRDAVPALVPSCVRHYSR